LVRAEVVETLPPPTPELQVFKVKLQELAILLPVAVVAAVVRL
jgi:hypothetical protein